MKAAVRTAAVLLLALAALAGCGGDDDGGAEGEMRSVVHAMGTTEVSAHPERAVVLDTGELDSAIALGVTPVGAVEAIPGEGFSDYLADAAKEIEIVGSIDQPDLEAIAALEPDLILSSKVRHEAIYDQLAAIAPTVFTEDIGVAWKENFPLHAEALGRVEEGEELTTEYEADVAAFKADMGDRLADTHVSVVRSVGDEVRVYLNANFIGTVLKDLGLPRPPAQDVDDFSLTATLENLEDADGDVMFLSRYGPDHPILDRLMGSPLWQRLDAVKAGRVFDVPDDLWFLGLGNLAAREVIADLRTLLIDGKPLEEPAAAAAE
ncbi:MAG: iron-siderophore transport system substrate-binding protein [Miltoncostaeaceae bacterium]|nr:iron-siderophore transport system substrate-binding protein [Miltoncostaeaceae bacterium]